MGPARLQTSTHTTQHHPKDPEFLRTNTHTTQHHPQILHPCTPAHTRPNTTHKTPHPCTPAHTRPNTTHKILHPTHEKQHTTHETQHHPRDPPLGASEAHVTAGPMRSRNCRQTRPCWCPHSAGCWPGGHQSCGGPPLLHLQPQEARRKDPDNRAVNMNPAGSPEGQQEGTKAAGVCFCFACSHKLRTRDMQE